MSSVTNSAAFDGSGGFVVNQSFPLFSSVDSIISHNLSDAVQIKYNVRDLNYKIGVVTDACGNHLASKYNTVDGDLLTNSLEIDTTDFLNNLTSGNIIQVGKLSALYSDFVYSLETYFGGTITVGGTIFNVNNGIFDKDALIKLSNGHNFNIQGSIVSDLSGGATVSDINDKLQKAIANNPFNNRNENTRIRDGFQVGDIVLIPDGFTISLSIDINPGPGNTSGVDALFNVDNSLNFVNTNTKVKKTTIYSTNNITQTYVVPIAFILSHDADYTFSTYSQVWTDISSISGKNWQRASISSDGQYQNAIASNGDIYCSPNYGSTWNFKTSINASSACSLNMSFNGKYQVACNGQAVHVSNDYGSTWSNNFTTTDTIINTNVSLNGQYIVVISSGDGVYISNDFGSSWSKFDEDNSLTHSLRAFPTADVGISFTGQYQTIAAGYIYYSHDYGANWNPFTLEGNEPFESQDNWTGVAVTSQGDIQYAVANNGLIYKSINYGVTWSPIVNATVPNKNYVSIACSASGQYITVLEHYGSIYYSMNYGSDWESYTMTQGSSNFTNIAMSSNARYQIITTQEHDTDTNLLGGLYFSSLS